MIDFSKVNILIIGDIMLDSFYHSKSVRESPEAPIPIIESFKSEQFLGGSGNVLRNVLSLGGNAEIISSVGSDFIGREVIKELKKLNMDCSSIMKIADMNTTHKQRYFIDEKPIYRLDVDSKYQKGLFLNKKKIFLDKLKDKHIVILSDYNKGFLDKEFIKFIINHSNLPVIVDPKKKDFKCYKNSFCLTPNILEIQMALNDFNALQLIENKITKLKNQLNIENIVVTKGEEGMCLFSDSDVTNFSAVNIEKPDVVGAGDTVIACLALCIAAGLNLPKSIAISLKAASIVVGKKGTNYVTKKELDRFTSNLF